MYSYYSLANYYHLLLLRLYIQYIGVVPLAISILSAVVTDHFFCFDDSIVNNVQEGRKDLPMGHDKHLSLRISEESGACTKVSVISRGRGSVLDSSVVEAWAK